MTILQQLLASLRRRLPSDPPLRAIHPPPGGSAERTSPFTFVLLETEPPAAGMAYNLLEDDEARARYDALDLEAIVAGGPALQQTSALLAGEPARRVVGYAICHALSQLALRDPDPSYHATDEDLLEVLAPGPDDHVGLVGYAGRMVRRLGQLGAARVTVLERPGRRELPEPPPGVTVSMEPPDLSACNKVLITSTTLLNDTFDELEGLTRGAAFRAVYGPGAGILPDPLFARGIDAVASMLVVDAEALVQRQLRGQRWREARTKRVLLREPR